MKSRARKLLAAFAVLALLLTINSRISTALAQGTAFTYQGQLQNNGALANGTYNLEFSLFNVATGGSAVAGPVTTNGVIVTNGLFTVTIDFGGAAWNGDTNWLLISVETNGGGSFTTLSPRQEVTPTPYAIFAEGANAAGLSGTVPAGDLNLTGVSGSGLVGLNASDLTSGTVTAARLPSDVAYTDVNQTFTADNTFSGPGQSLIIDGGPISTSLFTGLGLQYYASGEGAIMSSFNDGFGYLTFYTKQGSGFPIVQQMQIDKWGGVHIDQQGVNTGEIDSSSTNGVGLTFGIASGEGIASQRQLGTTAKNQYGLDFYTDFAKRMSITQSGFVGIGTQTPVNSSDTQLGLYSPTTNGYDGMWIETGVGGIPFYGYSEGGSFTAWTEVNGQNGNAWELYNDGFWLTVTPSGDVGINTTTPSENLEINGTSRIDNYDIYMRGAGDYNHGLGYREYVNGSSIYIDGPFLYGYNAGCLGTSDPDTAALTWSYTGDVWISNNCSVASLTIRGGADLAEPFPISQAQLEMPPGSVVVIDDQHPGHLKLSDESYDTRVVGVISGANGIHPGIQMQQQGLMEGDKNVALTGRVYVRANATYGAIRPGDFLTTSPTPGCAMKVTDHLKSEGAVLGKAMTGLSEGQGMVLVVVTLQ